MASNIPLPAPLSVPCTDGDDCVDDGEDIKKLVQQMWKEVHIFYCGVCCVLIQEGTSTGCNAVADLTAFGHHYHGRRKSLLRNNKSE